MHDLFCIMYIENTNIYMRDIRDILKRVYVPYRCVTMRTGYPVITSYVSDCTSYNSFNFSFRLGYMKKI